MNMDKNIIYGKTLNEYKRKYRNCKRNLLFYSKEEVETFDAKFSKSAQVDKVLLQGRKWAYINGTYYEIPKAPGWTWFRNLNSTVQIFTCGLLGVGLAVGITLPTVNAVIKNKNQGIKVTVIGASYDEASSQIELNKESSVVVKYANNKKVKKVNYVKIGGIDLTENLDYTVVRGQTSSTKIIIKQHAMISNEIEISVVLKDKPEYLNPVDFYTCSWSEMLERCEKFESGEYDDEDICFTFKFGDAAVNDISEFIGKERTIKVNKQDHIVRVIGTNHDLLVNQPSGRTDAKAAFTFEFKTLISDEDGYSLSYLWNEATTAKEREESNYDYANSTLRKMLGGNETKITTENFRVTQKGIAPDPSHKVPYTEYGEAKWDKDTDNKLYSKTVFSMLPTDLTDVIKPVTKPVGIYNKTTSKFEEKTTNDKLFILSAKEMGNTYSFDEGYGYTYDYYSNEPKVYENRIKKHVKNDGVNYVSLIGYTDQKKFEDVIYTFSANYNTLTGGSMYWTRSPATFFSRGRVYCVLDDGMFDLMNIGADFDAMPIAPAFCI